MPRNRFVKPEAVTLPLSDGDWILVKRQLNAGEQRTMFVRMMMKTPEAFNGGPPQEPRIDPAEVMLSTILTYLVDWSFVDDTGARVVIFRQPIEVVRAALDAIDVESYKEIVDAVQTHADALTAEAEALKANPTGEHALSLT